MKEYCVEVLRRLMPAWGRWNLAHGARGMATALLDAAEAAAAAPPTERADWVPGRGGR